MAFIPAKCTQCGANIRVDDTKEAGVCEFCGTAFITEKAINNYNTFVTNNFAGANINVTGANIENLLKLARNAEEARNYEEANNYYSRALELDPSNREALIGKGATVCLQGQIADATARELISYADKALEGCTDKEFVLKILNKVSECGIMFAAGGLQIYTQNQKLERAFHIFITALGACVDADYYVKSKVEELGYAKDEMFKELYVDALKGCVKWSTELCKEREYVSAILQGPFVDTEEKSKIKVSVALHEKYMTIYNDAVDKLKEIDPTFNAPSINQQKEVSSGCYIATCVYGSYDCPQVWTLRRFRDYNLDTTWAGRLFIRCYYAVSPTLVKLFGNQRWFKAVWKSWLDLMVKKLNDSGVADTKYQDKY